MWYSAAEGCVMHSLHSWTALKCKITAKNISDWIDQRNLEGGGQTTQSQSGLLNCFDVKCTFINSSQLHGLKQPFESPLVSRSIILASTVMSPACDSFFVTFFFSWQKKVVCKCRYVDQKEVSPRVCFSLWLLVSCLYQQTSFCWYPLRSSGEGFLNTSVPEEYFLP